MCDNICRYIFLALSVTDLSKCISQAWSLPLSIFFMKSLPLQLFLCPLSSAAWHFAARHFAAPSLHITFPLFLKFCMYILPQPILLLCNLEEETPSLLLLCTLPRLEDYQHSFTMLLELARSSHSRCVPAFTQTGREERERERKQQNISDRTKTLKAKRRGAGRL